MILKFIILKGQIRYIIYKNFLKEIFNSFKKFLNLKIVYKKIMYEYRIKYDKPFIVIEYVEIQTIYKTLEKEEIQKINNECDRCKDENEVNVLKETCHECYNKIYVSLGDKEIIKSTQYVDISPLNIIVKNYEVYINNHEYKFSYYGQDKKEEFLNKLFTLIKEHR